MADNGWAKLIPADGARTVGVWPGALKPGDLVSRFGWLHEVASVETYWIPNVRALGPLECVHVKFTSSEEYRGHAYSTVQRVEDRPV